MTTPKTVCIESPFRNPLPEVPLIGELYRDYLHDCLRDSLSRGEAPFAGHAYLPFVLNDGDEDERRQGIDCHLAWLAKADKVALYIDFGFSAGMSEAYTAAKEKRERRWLPAWHGVGEYTRGFISGWDGSVGLWTTERHRGSIEGGRRDPALFRP